MTGRQFVKNVYYNVCIVVWIMQVRCEPGGKVWNKGHSRGSSSCSRWFAGFVPKTRIQCAACSPQGLWNTSAHVFTTRWAAISTSPSRRSSLLLATSLDLWMGLWSYLQFGSRLSTTVVTLSIPAMFSSSCRQTWRTSPGVFSVDRMTVSGWQRLKLTGSYKS